MSKGWMDFKQQGAVVLKAGDRRNGVGAKTRFLGRVIVGGWNTKAPPKHQVTPLYRT